MLIGARRRVISNISKNKVVNKVKFVLSIFVYFFISACSTATTESLWNAEKIGKISSVLVFSTARNVSNRGEIERDLVAELSKNGIYAKSSLDLLGADFDPKNSVQDIIVSEKLSAFSNALVVSIIDVKRHQDYVPSDFGSDYGFYGTYGYRGYYDYSPGYYEEVTTYQVASHLYNLARKKLVWSEVASITNPASLKSGSVDLSKNISENLAKQIKKYPGSQ